MVLGKIYLCVVLKILYYYINEDVDRYIIVVRVKFLELNV